MHNSKNLSIVSYIIINLLLICFLWVIFTSCDRKTQPLKILAIGNSFTEGATDKYLVPLAKENGDSLIIFSLILGTSDLETHWNNIQTDAHVYNFKFIYEDSIIFNYNSSILFALQYQDWDYIVIQQLSSKCGLYETYYPYIELIKQYLQYNALNNKVKIVFHQTWAYDQNSTHGGFAKYDKNQITMYNAITTTVERVCNEMNIKTIIPSGTAIQNARGKLGDIFCRDGYHVNDLGSYVLACTWFEIFYNEDCFNTTIRPKTAISDENLYSSSVGT
ncbi:MAG: DUF4886 domain-containing protein [Bacteroidales bacterium]|jgi:hypothetical protein|nr:DUF4886 domain-containing protein [Bacteroidales bacterium]